MKSFIKKADIVKYYDNLKDNNKYKLFQEDIDITYSKKFIICDPKIIYENIESNNISHYYEFWTDKMPLKLAIDIDYIQKYDSVLCIPELLIKIINIILEAVDKYYKHKYNIDDIIVLENEKLEYKNDHSTKYSAHIIFKNLAFQNYMILKDFYTRLEKEYKISDYNVDKAIYNLTCLRLLWCSKKGKELRLIPKKLIINNKSTAYPKYNDNYNFFLDSLITNIDKSTKIITSNNIKYKINTVNTIDNISNINIEEILNQLPSIYYDDYENWIKIGMILYRYKDYDKDNHDKDNKYFKLWDNWSLQSEKYTNQTYKKWKSFSSESDKNLTIGTLIYIAKIENCNNIYKKLGIQEKVNSYPIKSIELNTKNKTTKIINSPKLSENHIKDLLEISSKLICIQSEKGTGKTTNLFKVLFDDNKNNITSDTTILVVSSRITFSYKILGDLKKYDFTIYHDYKDYNINAKKIICQFDSLMRLEISNYDIIIVDECETLAKYITSIHYIKNNKADLTLEYFQSLIIEAKQIYIMDADLSDRCINFYSKLIESSDNNMSILINTHHPFKEYTIKYSAKETWLRNLLIFIKNNKKIAIAMASNSKAKDIKNLISNKLELEQIDKKILLINRETDENEKKNLLLNVNETWKKYDIIIYTPSVCMGVSFDLDNYFDYIFVYGCSGSLEAQSLCQMIHRVRNPKYKEIYLTVDDYIEYNADNDNINYNIVEEMLCLDYYLIEHDLHNNLIKKKISGRDKHITYPYKDEPIYDLYVRNCKERIENNLNFTACLFGYIKYKEYKLEYICSNNIEADKELWNELLDLKNERIEIETDEKINGILNIELINKEEYLNLIQKFNEYITKEELYKICKYNLVNCYNIDNVENLSNEFIQKYYDKEKMKYFRNLNLIKNTNEQTTNDKLEILKHNEKYEANISNCYTNFNNRNKFTYHYFPQEIIKILKFDINDLSISNLEDEIFIKNINIAINFCNEYKYEIAYKYNLRITNKNLIDLDLMNKINYLNKILYDQYGIKIKKIKNKSSISYILDDNDIWNNKLIIFKSYNINYRNQKNQKTDFDTSLLDIFVDDND